jgi:hypothetical protein
MESERLCLKGHFVIDGFRGRLPLLEPPSVRLDELDGVPDDLEGAAVLAIVGRPLVLIEDSGDGYPGTLMQILGTDIGQLVEGHALDPAGFLFAGLESDVEGCHGVSVGRVKDLGIVSQVPGHDALIDHGCFSFLKMMG